LTEEITVQQKEEEFTGVLSASWRVDQPELANMLRELADKT